MPNVYVPDVTVTLVVETCCNCHVVFAMPSDLVTRRRDDHNYFYCPNGHGQHYTGETEAQKLARELKARNADLDRAKTQLRNKDEAINSLETQTIALGRKLAARKGVTTRLKRRLVNGQCPCCSRKFKDLKTHMATEHPSFDLEKEVAAREAKPV